MYITVGEIFLNFALAIFCTSFFFCQKKKKREREKEGSSVCIFTLRTGNFSNSTRRKLWFIEFVYNFAGSVFCHGWHNVRVPLFSPKHSYKVHTHTHTHSCKHTCKHLKHSYLDTVRKSITQRIKEFIA